MALSPHHQTLVANMSMTVCPRCCQMETELREHADQIAKLKNEKHALERQLESATKVNPREISSQL